MDSNKLAHEIVAVFFFIRNEFWTVFERVRIGFFVKWNVQVVPENICSISTIKTECSNYSGYPQSFYQYFINL